MHLNILNLSPVILLMKFLFFCERLFLEKIFLFVFGLLSLFFRKSIVCSLCEWPSLLTYLTLLSFVIFRNVIFVQKVFDSINLKQLA